MAFFLLMTGMAFFITDLQVRIAIVALGIYGHVIAYSPGEGPVPFTYSAEAFPLYIRDLGMSYAVAITWGFNFIIAFTFPILLSEFRPQGSSRIPLFRLLSTFPPSCLLLSRFNFEKACGLC